MTILDVTVNFTLNDPAIWLIAGAIGGVATGQLMKSRGSGIVLDLFFGVLGALLGVYVVGAILGVGRYGPVAVTLMAAFGGMVLVVMSHLLGVVRKHARAV